VSQRVEALLERPGVGVACPLIRFPDGDRVWFSRGWSGWTKGRPVAEGGRRASEFYGREPTSTGDANGRALMVGSRLVASIGLLCSDYFLYCERADPSERAGRAGFERIAVPAARIGHRVSATSKRGSPDAIYYQTPGRLGRRSLFADAGLEVVELRPGVPHRGNPLLRVADAVSGGRLQQLRVVAYLRVGRAKSSDS
jgi:GT2 family glycosyltransferase